MKRKAYAYKVLIIFLMLIFTSLSFSADKPAKTAKPSNTEKTETPKPIKRIDTMIAVFDLETVGNVDKYVSRPLSESIRREVFKSGKWELIDRGNMDKVFGEQKFQLSGCVTGQCIVEAGQMLGVGKIVAGTVSLIGKTYYLSLSLINAETGKIEAQSEDKCKCELDELIDSSKRLIAKLIGESIGSPVKELTSKSFSLEELEQNMKRDKADWDKKTEDMKLAYNKVLEYEKKENISPEIKANAWKHFSESFKEDNPQSTEDDKMRKKAKNQSEYWLAMASGKIIDPATGMEIVFVKGGCFQMGDTFGDGESDEKPVHEVCVDDYYIGKYEVTQGQWKAIMGNNPSHFKDCGDNCPVEQVSWNDVQEFIQKLNEKNNPPSPPFTKGGKGGFRLPTEAEWEYAARSGGKSERYSGGNDIDSVAWYNKNSGGKTHPVGTKQPNGLGIYDMSGNVWEWVNDWYDEFYYKNSPKNNPT
ncbi:MAG: SUMF1/EgtB/PvdO family nonheme iron enzyme, partial [Nitrospirota bacterium]|nr:SUMF1/EgtB/PvdO family nonheme iron enzyme [Nitrospirota bacterium]